MKFCDDEIDFMSVFDVFQGIYDKYKDIENVSVLQGIALAREMSNSIDDFISKVETITAKALICKVMSYYDIDSFIDEVTENIQEIFDKFNEFDDAIASIQADDMTLEEIINMVEPIFGSFEEDKNKLKEKINEILKDLFSPLLEMGASQSDIDDAFDDVEFNASPTEYIIEIFTTIADNTIRNQ